MSEAIADNLCREHGHPEHLCLACKTAAGPKGNDDD